MGATLDDACDRLQMIPAMHRHFVNLSSVWHLGEPVYRIARCIIGNCKQTPKLVFTYSSIAFSRMMYIPFRSVLNAFIERVCVE